MKTITGPIIFVGYGSIGRGVLALIEKHFTFRPEQVTIIEPDADQLKRGSGHLYQHVHDKLTPANYVTLLDSILKNSVGQPIIINLSVEVSSVALIAYAGTRNALYIDTVIEPWPGVYDDFSRSPETRTNYFFREELLSLRKERGVNTPTAVSCCGANPGMVSWLTKRALLQIAKETRYHTEIPTTRHAWAELAMNLGIHGIHIAERDDQVTEKIYPSDVFVNTWSVEGLISEALQPAELGWGSYETQLPEDARTHTKQNACGIYLDSYGAATKISTWVPSHGAIESFLVTHNEALSISDYLTVTDKEQNVIYRPTVHYAYHPCDQTVKNLETLLTDGLPAFTKFHVLDEHEITGGFDELGVLLYGHEKNAYWYGSKLSTAEAIKLAPYQNATGMQVSSAVLAGISWMLDNPQRGIVEAEDMDHEYCLQVQEPYLGKLYGSYTDWQPNQTEDIREAWQFNKLRISNN
jgi:homospermidine synthase